MHGISIWPGITLNGEACSRHIFRSLHYPITWYGLGKDTFLGEQCFNKQSQWRKGIRPSIMCPRIPKNDHGSFPLLCLCRRCTAYFGSPRVALSNALLAQFLLWSRCHLIIWHLSGYLASSPLLSGALLADRRFSGRLGPSWPLRAPS